MSITHVTAHYLKRDIDTPAQLSLRPSPLAIDEQKTTLLDQLKSSFLARLNRVHGSFNETAPLASVLDSFLSNNQDFTQATMDLMARLEKGMNEANIAMNAHFLFFTEQAGDDHQVFYLFIVHQNESLTISDQLEVMPSYTIDTGPSLAGIKVDVAEWQRRKNYAYLTLLCPRGNAVLAELLEGFSGFSNGVNKEGDTKSFLDGVDAFAKQLPDDKVQEYRAQVVDYCLAQDDKDEAVNIEELSRELGSVDRERFVQEIKSHQPEADNDLMVDRRSLKRYVKFAGREKDLAISFSTYHLHSRIDYDIEDDVLTIKGVPKALRTQLLAYME